MTDTKPDSQDEEFPSIFEQTTTDAQAEEEGKWFVNVYQGVDFKIRRSTSEVATKARQNIVRKYHKHAVNGEFSKQMQSRILAELLASAILVDWRGKAMKDETGAPLEYSLDNAKALLEKLPNVRLTIAGIADNMDNFRVESGEVIAGNSKAS